MTISIGEPYEVSKTGWACSASIEGLHGRFPDMHGVDSWQALQLAQQIIAQMLVHFVDDGGRLVDPEERELITPEELFPTLSVPGQQRIG
jgi:hypothetical protein